MTYSKQLFTGLATAVLLSLSLNAFAQEAAIKKAVEERIGSGIKVDGVQRSPMPGVYEIRIGTDIFYADEKAQYLIMGSIQELKSGKNFTQERLDGLAVEAVFSTANKANALKLVKGNGKREIAVFEDVNCGFCKKLRPELDKLTNVTIYTYLIPILSQDSEVKLRGVWCARDRNKTYDDWMMRGIVPPAADERCKVPVDDVQNLARNLKVTGTPAMFFASGKRVPGYIDATQIERNLAAQ